MPGWNFASVFKSPGWNFTTLVTCKQDTRFFKRPKWVHPGVNFTPDEIKHVNYPLEFRNMENILGAEMFFFFLLLNIQ